MKQQIIIIRKCLSNDIGLFRHLQPQGWSDITLYFRFYCKQDFCYPIVAICGRKIVGVANAIMNGDTGWLAHIIVDEEYRRMGIGYKLTEHLIEYLHRNGCKTLLLIATEMGEGLYRKFGFTTVSEYLFFEGGTFYPSDQIRNIRKYREANFEIIMDIDKYITSEERTNMLSQFLGNSWVYGSDTQIEGYFMSDFDEGMILATNDEVGLSLLLFKNSLQKRKNVLPIENKSGIEFLLSHGAQNVDRAPRMILGEKIEWKPELIFSRAGGFYG